jgi:DNA-binding MarR family transcriptional regulator
MRDVSLFPVAPARTLESVAEEPRWLDDCERDAWIALARLMFNLPSALDAQLLRDNQLTLFDYFVLSTLSMTSGWTLRLSDLAAHIGSSLSRLSNVVKRLEQRGLLRREPDPENSRYTRATLTDAGWDTVVAAAPGHVAAVRRFVIDGLTEEQVEVLREVACHVMRRLDEFAAEGAGRPQPVEGETPSEQPRG